MTRDEVDAALSFDPFYGSPPKPYKCAGCGERFDTYDEANSEGKFHDHWTAAP